MDKITVSLTEAQLVWLAEEAKKAGLSISEVLRRIIDKARGTL